MQELFKNYKKLDKFIKVQLFVLYIILSRHKGVKLIE